MSRGRRCGFDILREEAEDRMAEESRLAERQAWADAGVPYPDHMLSYDAYEWGMALGVPYPPSLPAFSAV